MTDNADLKRRLDHTVDRMTVIDEEWNRRELELDEHDMRSSLESEWLQELMYESAAHVWNTMEMLRAFDETYRRDQYQELYQREWEVSIAKRFVNGERVDLGGIPVYTEPVPPIGAHFGKGKGKARNEPYDPYARMTELFDDEMRPIGHDQYD
jgi:hypothetical protein